MNNQTDALVIKWQYAMLTLAFVTVIVSGLLTIERYHTFKYVFLTASIPMVLADLSSIIFRVSIFRRGFFIASLLGPSQKGYIKGTPAALLGIFMLVGQIVVVIIVFITPGFSNLN